MKVLITGGRGFVGKHLMRELGATHTIFSYDLIEGEDIRDYEKLRSVIESFQPDYIYHLAGQAFVPESNMDVRRTFEVMTMGTINLLEAVRHTGCRAKILLAGTSGEYGFELDDDELTEKTRPNPDTPYGIAKLSATHLGMWYAKQYKMTIVVTRAFNHIGPGQSANYAVPSFARQVVQAENGQIDCVRHGNLESSRNFTDVRDMVKAYIKAIELPSDIYNICSNQNVTMQQVMGLLVNNADHTIKTKEDSSLFRPSTLTYIKPSCKKFTDLTGWRAEIRLEETLIDILNEWRQNAL